MGVPCLGSIPSVEHLSWYVKYDHLLAGTFFPSSNVLLIWVTGHNSVLVMSLRILPQQWYVTPHFYGS